MLIMKFVQKGLADPGWWSSSWDGSQGSENSQWYRGWDDGRGVPGPVRTGRTRAMAMQIGLLHGAIGRLSQSLGLRSGLMMQNDQHVHGGQKRSSF